jgi:hypothetical protein
MQRRKPHARGYLIETKKKEEGIDSEIRDKSNQLLPLPNASAYKQE